MSAINYHDQKLLVEKKGLFLLCIHIAAHFQMQSCRSCVWGTDGEVMEEHSYLACSSCLSEPASLYKSGRAVQRWHCLQLAMPSLIKEMYQRLSQLANFGGPFLNWGSVVRVPSLFICFLPIDLLLCNFVLNHSSIWLVLLFTFSLQTMLLFSSCFFIFTYIYCFIYLK